MKPRLFVLVLLVVILSATGCTRSRPQRAPTQTLDPQAGGMVLPTLAPPEPTPTAIPLPSELSIGQQVIAVGERPLRVQADAFGTAQVLEVYPPGAIFTVVEPSVAYDSYPVQNEGRTWYRLQAADGLVGWAVIDAIVANE
jgi:hypothetical protein